MIHNKPKRKIVRTIEMEHELMLHDTKTKKIHVLNPSASIIWFLCDGFHTLEQISTEMKKNFKDSGEDILQDVCQTVEKLRKDGLME